MKNIYIIPTDKPSRLGLNNGVLEYAPLFGFDLFDKNKNFKHNPINIYITSDEKIEEGDWFYSVRELIEKAIINYPKGENFGKIILTTDQDLIKDGVQAISDEFLEWFVKNPSCESVEVTKDRVFKLDEFNQREFYNNYKIIFPQEEPKQETFTYTEAAKKEERIFNSTMMKQETLEEDVEMDETIAWHLAKKRFAESLGHAPDINKKTHELIVSSLQEGILAGVKWQAEKMYSEEEVKHIISEALQSALVTVDFEQWFKQFKKK